MDYMAKTKAMATAAKSRAARGERPSSSGTSASRGASRGSSVDDRDASQTPREKALVGNYDLSSLPSEWDLSPDVRKRMRDDMNLVTACDQWGKESNLTVTATKPNVKLNACVLRPVAVLMEQNDLLLPAIDRLIMAIEEYYVLAKRTISHEAAYHEAWAIRRLIGKLKRTCYRDNVPEDHVFYI